MVDAIGPTMDFPGLSMITGLLGNALGLDHRDREALQRLQGRLQVAARQDRRGVLLEDFQTVDLGRPAMVDTGWTTRGAPESRGGASGTGTHIRQRRYWADSLFTVALRLDPPEEAPSVEHLAAAVQKPARPLFLGRKSCLPSGPLFLEIVEAPSLRAALEQTPRLPTSWGDYDDRPLAAWWPAEEGHGTEGRLVPTADLRDWHNQIHTGRRMVFAGLVSPPAPEGP